MKNFSQYTVFNVVYPSILVLCGIVITICNFFPFVRVLPGGLLIPGGDPAYPSFDRICNMTNQTTVWGCVLAEPGSSAIDYVVAGLLVLGIGLLFFRVKWKRLLATLAVVIAIVGFLLMSITTWNFVNDSSDAYERYPANVIAMVAYGVVIGVSCLRILWELGLPSPPLPEKKTL